VTTIVRACACSIWTEWQVLTPILRCDEAYTHKCLNIHAHQKTSQAFAGIVPLIVILVSHNSEIQQWENFFFFFWQRRQRETSPSIW